LTTPSGEKLHVIGTGGPDLFRLEDGVKVCSGLPMTAKGHTPLLVGDLYLWKTSGDNRPVSRKVFRLTAPSRDTVTFAELWAMERDGGSAGSTDAYFDGVIYDGSFAVRAATGEVLCKVERGGVPSGEGPSSVVAGNHVIGIDKGRLLAGVRRLDGGPVTRGRFHDTRDRDDDEWFQRYGWWRGGSNTPGPVAPNGSPSAQANRLFWRSKGYLWCVGDPAQPFPTPGNCPARARVRP
jgi:hypothetical protein